MLIANEILYAIWIGVCLPVLSIAVIPAGHQLNASSTAPTRKGRTQLLFQSYLRPAHFHGPCLIQTLKRTLPLPSEPRPTLLTCCSPTALQQLQQTNTQWRTILTWVTCQQQRLTTVIQHHAWELRKSTLQQIFCPHFTLWWWYLAS